MGIVSPKQDGGQRLLLQYTVILKNSWGLMHEQRRRFDGSSIYGQKLKIHFKGDGALSSSFVIERANQRLLPLVFISTCVISVAAAVFRVSTISKMFYVEYTRVSQYNYCMVSIYILI